MPDAELIKTFRDADDDKPVQAGTKVSWDRDPAKGLEIAHRLWGNESLPGQLSQILPRPQDFTAAMQLVPKDDVAESVTSGPGADTHAAQLRKYLDGGVDEVYLQQIGPDRDGFFEAWRRDVLPQLV